MAVNGLGAKLKKLFSGSGSDEEFYEDLEDLLIEGDIGASTAMELSDMLKDKFGKKCRAAKDEVTGFLQEKLQDMIKTGMPVIDPSRLNIILVLGVNGVGKTTSIAKMADFYRREYELEAVLSAGDTFRAAAIDQLKLHGERLNLRVIHQQPGSDPGAVIYDSIESAVSKGEKLIIADTAGRMHNKANLVKELQKIDKIIANKAPDANYQKILVIDATTGQNGFRQAELFSEAVKVDSIVLTKYDSTAKAGTAVSISTKLGIPFAFMGTGEKYSDFAEFDKKKFVENMLRE